MNHDTSISFLEREYELQTGFTTSASDPKGVIVKGICPQCHGETKQTFTVGQPGVAVDKAAWADGEEATVICACGAPHDRPKDSDESGCGAYWSVKLTRAAAS